MFLKILIATILCFYSCPDRIIEQCKQVYEYIKSDTLAVNFLEIPKENQKIMISDTINYYTHPFFYNDIIKILYGDTINPKMLEEIKLKMLSDDLLKYYPNNQLYSRDTNNTDIINMLKSIRISELSNVKFGNMIIYLSYRDSCFIFAELYKIPENISILSDKNIKWFNKSIYYMFYFDNLHIKRVIAKKIQG